MAIKQIQLQYSTFDLQYDENKTWTKDDTALIEAAETLIQYEIKKNKLSDEQFYAFAGFKKEMDIVETDFIEVNATVKGLIKEVDEFEFKLVGFNQTNIDKLNISLNATGTIITTFHQKLLQLSEMITVISPPINEDEDDNIDEQLEPEWELFDDIKHQHAQHWEQQSIDIVSFGDFEERMKANFEYLEKRNDNTKYYVNDITLNYNVFVAKIDGIYQLWEELQKRIILLNRFLNSTESIDQIQKLN